MPTIRIGDLIDGDPKIRGGRPKIAGTGVTVQRIVRWYKRGLSPKEIADNFEHLTLAQVHAALTSYRANQEEIESDLAAQHRDAASWEKEFAPSPFSSLQPGQIGQVLGPA